MYGLDILWISLRYIIMLWVHEMARYCHRNRPAAERGATANVDEEIGDPIDIRESLEASEADHNSKAVMLKLQLKIKWIVCPSPVKNRFKIIKGKINQSFFRPLGESQRLRRENTQVTSPAVS